MDIQGEQNDNQERCPNCGKILEPDEFFCAQCGAKLNRKIRSGFDLYDWSRHGGENEDIPTGGGNGTGGHAGGGNGTGGHAGGGNGTGGHAGGGNGTGGHAGGGNGTGGHAGTGNGHRGNSSGKLCPNCGAQQKKDAKKCQACGYEFERSGRPSLSAIAPVATLALLLGAGVLLIGAHLLKQSIQTGNTDVQSTEVETQTVLVTAQATSEQTSGGQAMTGPGPSGETSIVIYDQTEPQLSSGTETSSGEPASSAASESGQSTEPESSLPVEETESETQSGGEISENKIKEPETEPLGRIQDREQTEALTEAQTEAQTEDTELQIHSYEIKMEDCTWEEAFARCLSMGGYLLRINSLEEFSYVTGFVDDSGKEGQFYIGARRDPGSSAYYLVNEKNVLMGTRLDSGYTNWLTDIWLTGEPSYRDTGLNLDEYYITMFRYGDDKKWVINDVPNDLVGALSTNAGHVGYICELEQ